MGARVRVRGLTSRVELNGLEGLATAFSPDQGRYAIQVGPGRSIAIREENLLVLSRVYG